MKNSILVTAVFISLSLFSGCASNKLRTANLPKKTGGSKSRRPGPSPMQLCLSLKRTV